MLLVEHRKFLNDWFGFYGFLRDPFLMFGYQTLAKGFYKDCSSFVCLLKDKGLSKVEVVDATDYRADHIHDMTTPFYNHYQYEVVCDIGCIEHVSDAGAALSNCLYCVKIGGLYAVCTPVHGYYGHGYQTFHPSLFIDTLEANCFQIRYLKYSSKNGQEINKPTDAKDSLMWLIAERKDMKLFVNPIQKKFRNKKWK